MLILGIETSCDETAASVISCKSGKIKVLSNTIASSQNLHTKTGGIIPEVAAREQIKSIVPVVKESLTTARIKHESLDSIAVTTGPGLIGSLLVGVEAAKALSLVWDKPLIPVNHLVAHIYASWIDNTPPIFPLIGLVISGGHTDLVFMKSHSDIKWIGGTRDDAAGEAFDKTARLLNLGYPGGPEISKKAQKHRDTKSGKLDLLPRPLISEGSLDMSFSGLKTATSREISKKNLNDEEYVCHMAAQIEEAIVDVVYQKSLSAIEKFKPKSFVIAGGVAANKHLQNKFLQSEKNGWLGAGLHVPQPAYTTDNATMIAANAIFSVNHKSWKKISANPNLSITDNP